MTVSVNGMQSYVGAGGSDVALLGECLLEAVELLAGYLRHLRQLDPATDMVTGEIAATFDPATDGGSYTWADTRELAASDHAGPVSLVVLDRATREVCSDLFARRNAPNGIINQQFAGADGPISGPARIHRDPLTPAYPLLGKWAVPF